MSMKVNVIIQKKNFIKINYLLKVKLTSILNLLEAKGSDHD